MTPSGTEPVTFRFVAQHLSHCATAVPFRVIFLPENSACIEQMLKQFPSCFNASILTSADIRDETYVVHANRILHDGTHCALSCGDAMTQAFTYIARLMLSAGAMER